MTVEEQVKDLERKISRCEDEEVLAIYEIMLTEKMNELNPKEILLTI